MDDHFGFDMEPLITNFVISETVNRIQKPDDIIALVVIPL